MDSWTVDRKALGPAVLKLTQLSLEKAFQSIDADETLKAKMVHLRYQDTSGDTVNAIRRVCESTGLSFTPAYQKQVEDYMAKSNAARAKVTKSPCFWWALVVCNCQTVVLWH